MMSKRRSEARMGRMVGWIVIWLVLGAGTGCDAFGTSEQEEEAQEEVIPVRVDQIEAMRRTQRIATTGTLEAWEHALLSGQQGQRITRLDVDEGDEVRQGETIAVMDDTNLRQARVELRTLEREVGRLRELVEIGAVAQQQLDQTEAQLETAQTNVGLLETNTYLRSPINGTVTGKYFVAGEQYMPSVQAPALVTIQQLDPLKVVINVSERFFGTIAEGMVARVRVDAHREEFEGVVRRVSPTVDPQGRTFRVEIQLDNEAGRLSPGMFARVSLDIGEREAMFLPRSSIIRRPGQEPFVYVVEEGRAQVRRIEEGDRFEEYMEVVEGIRSEDRVVIEGMSRLSAGIKVDVVGEDARGAQVGGTGEREGSTDEWVEEEGQ